MKRVKKIFILILAIMIGVSSLPFIALGSVMTVSAATKVKTNDQRVYGGNSYTTSYAVANYLYKKTGKFNSVVIATGTNYPDALSSGYLSYANGNCPVLLVKPEIELEMIDYLKSHMKAKGTVYIAGGTAVVSQNFETKAKTAGFTVKRYAGGNRYGTNLSIVKNTWKKGGELLVATGTNYADVLSCSSAKRPILLVKDSLSTNQINWIKTAQVNKIYIIGGPNAVSTTVENQLKAYAPTERVYGSNRYGTSQAVAKKFFPKANTITLVRGDHYPDGLSGAPLAMMNDSTIFLVTADNYSKAHDYVVSKKILNSFTVGGSMAVTDQTVAKVMEQYVADHAHIYESSWTSDATNHWHKCIR